LEKSRNSALAGQICFSFSFIWRLCCASTPFGITIPVIFSAPGFTFPFKPFQGFKILSDTDAGK
jgi:hypothetical protein